MLAEEGIPVLIKNLIINEMEAGLSPGLRSKGVAVFQAFFRTLLPQIIQIKSGIHVFGNGPEEGVFYLGTVLFRISHPGKEKARLPLPPHGKESPGKIERWNAFEIKYRTLGNPVSFDRDLQFFGRKFPRRPRRIAGGERSFSNSIPVLS